MLLDDRDERPGVKFKDADLLGMPLRITLGARGLKEGVAEVKERADGASSIACPLAEIAQLGPPVGGRSAGDERRERIIFALDVDNAADALAWAERSPGRVGVFKVGLELFVSEGPEPVASSSGAARGSSST